MSKTKPTEATPQPGDRQPDTGKVWALCASMAECPEYPVGRWVTAGSPRKLEAAGYKRRCLTCSQRQRWTKPDAVHPRLRADNLPLLDGSTALLLKRSKEDIRNRVSLVVCGVCDETPPEKVNITSGEDSGGVCEKCLPWLTLLLTRKQYTVDSAERGRAYSKIRRVRRWLAAGVSAVEPGPGMPFWALAESWAAWYQRVYEVTSWGVYMAYFRHFILYFEDMPISEIGIVQVREVEEALLSGAVCREPLARTTVTKASELLRRIFKYGKGEGWLKEIPFQPMAITRAHRKAAPRKGRRRGPEPQPAEDFIRDVYRVIDELLSSDGEATLPLAAPRIQLLGHDLGEEAIRKKLKRKAKVTWEVAVRQRRKNLSGQVLPLNLSAERTS
jgi:hypothetical protein